jgi:hypothetical protein
MGSLTAETAVSYIKKRNGERKSTGRIACATDGPRLTVVY